MQTHFFHKFFHLVNTEIHTELPSIHISEHGKQMLHSSIMGKKFDVVSILGPEYTETLTVAAEIIPPLLIHVSRTETYSV